MNSYRHESLRRRRHPLAGLLLVILLVAAWLLAAGVLGGRRGGDAPVTQSPGSGLVPVASTSYVVQPGDTLWAMARHLQPSGDLRPLVDQLSRHTAGRPLRAGERISLP